METPPPHRLHRRADSEPEQVRRGGRRLKLALLANLVLAVALAYSLQTAEAATPFVVNSTGTATDAKPGDGSCATSSGVCTLRAAVHEANVLPGTDNIQVPAGTYPISRPSGSNGIATGDLDIESDVTITGAGATGTIIDGRGLDRVIEVRPRVGPRRHIRGNGPRRLPS
jgi:large repetitive protein